MTLDELIHLATRDRMPGIREMAGKLLLEDVRRLADEAKAAMRDEATARAELDAVRAELREALRHGQE